MRVSKAIVLNECGFKDGHSKGDAFYQECLDFCADESHIHNTDTRAKRKACHKLYHLVGPTYFNADDRNHLQKGALTYTSENVSFELFQMLWGHWQHFMEANRQVHKRQTSSSSETSTTSEDLVNVKDMSSSSRPMDVEAQGTDNVIHFMYPHDTIAKVKRRSTAARQAMRSSSWILKWSPEKEYLVSREERNASSKVNWYVRGEEGQLWPIKYLNSRRPNGGLWSLHHYDGTTEKIFRDSDGLFGEAVVGAIHRPGLGMLVNAQKGSASSRFFAATGWDTRHSTGGDGHASSRSVASPFAGLPLCRPDLQRPRPGHRDSITIDTSAETAKRSHAALISSDGPDTDTDLTGCRFDGHPGFSTPESASETSPTSKKREASLAAGQLLWEAGLPGPKKLKSTGTELTTRLMDLKREASQDARQKSPALTKQDASEAANQNTSLPALLASEVPKDAQSTTGDSTGLQLPASKKVKPTISEYILESTRLRISLSSLGHLGTIRASLLDCLTVEQFFERVLGKWWDEIPEEKMDTVPLSLTYGWGGPTQCVKQKDASVYQYMLEDIAAAPCWNNGEGSCEIAIVINA